METNQYIPAFIDSIKRDTPYWLINVKFICVECGEQSIQLYDCRCPNPSCPSHKAGHSKEELQLSLAVGISILREFEKMFGVKIVEQIDNELKDKLFSAVDGLISNDHNRPVSFDDIFEFYRQQHNQNAQAKYPYIRRISVEGLFGSNTFSFYLNDNLSIIYGSNGFGKTTIFRFLEYTLNNPRANDPIKNREAHLSAVRWFLSTPFKSFLIELQSGDWIKATKIQDSGSTQVFFSYSRPEFKTISVGRHVKGKGGINSIQIFKHYNYVKRIFPVSYNSQGFLFIKVNRLSDQSYTDAFFTKENLRRLISPAIPSGLSPAQSEEHVASLILDYWTKIKQPKVYSDFAQELKTICSSVLGSVKTIKVLDFFKYFEKEASQKTIDTLNDENDLLSKLALGIVPASTRDNKTCATFEASPSTDKENDVNNFIRCVIENPLPRWDARRIALRRLFDFYRKFVLLRNSFESLYADECSSRKLLDIGDENTLIVRTSKTLNDDFSEILPIQYLSSGELNALTILYSLIFKSKFGSIILIDEPEVSLHLAWQQQLSKFIQELTKGKSQVIIATHSPFITADNDECYIGATFASLKGGQNGK